MAHVQVHEDVTLDEPMLVDGLPGVGLVGKIVADHLVDTLDATLHATVHCEGLPEVAVYREGDATVRAPVRIYAVPDEDLLALRSDVPVSPAAAEDFAGCIVDWLDELDATPVFQSGRPTENNTDPGLYGVATGDGDGLLTDADVGPPPEDGAVSGPTGALLHRAQRVGLTGVGLVVDAEPKFPDPAAARVLLVDGIGPITGTEVETDTLIEQAEEISEARAQLAEQMQSADEGSSEARPMGMYQ
jgi:uncharacterized protein